MDPSYQRIIATLYFALVLASGQEWADRAKEAMLFFADDADPKAARFLRALASETNSLLSDGSEAVA